MGKIKLLTRLSYLMVTIFCFLFAFEYIHKIYQLESRLVTDNLQSVFKELEKALDSELAHASTSITVLENIVQNKIKKNIKFEDRDLVPMMETLITNNKNQFNIYFAFDDELSRKIFNVPAIAFTLHKDKALINSEEYHNTETFVLEKFNNPTYLQDPAEVWYHSGKISRGVEVTDIYFDKTYMKVWMFSIVKGIYINDKFRGVVGVDFFIENLLKSISRNSQKVVGTLALVDNKTKRIFYYPYPDETPVNFSAINLDEVLKGNARNLSIMSKDGEDYILNSSYLPSYRWSYVSLIRKDAIYREVFSKVKMLLFICFLVMLANLLIVYLIFNYLNRFYFDIITQNQTRGITKLIEGLCHEINNPLATLSLCLGAMKRILHKKSDPQPIEGLVEKSERAGKRIQILIEELRSLTSSTEVVNKLVLVGELVEELKKLFKEDLNEFKISFGFETHQEDGISCDPLKLLQALMPLMENAIEAIQDHDERWIKIVLEKGKNQACISFIDSGPGIRGAMREKLFLPFYTTKTEDLKKGLGLTIAKSTIEQLGGTLAFVPTARHTTFKITLPI